MKRRTILKTLPAITLLPAALKLNIVEADEHKAAPKAAAAKSGSKKTEMPDYAGKIGYSDMSNTDADGNTQPGFSDRSSKPKNADPKAPYQMPLTQEEQDILDGKKGPELAKVMKPSSSPMAMPSTPKSSSIWAARRTAPCSPGRTTCYR